jgi:hypothetical protein
MDHAGMGADLLAYYASANGAALLRAKAKSVAARRGSFPQHAITANRGKARR